MFLTFDMFLHQKDVFLDDFSSADFRSSCRSFQPISCDPSPMLLFPPTNVSSFLSLLPPINWLDAFPTILAFRGQKDASRWNAIHIAAQFNRPEVIEFITTEVIAFVQVLNADDREMICKNMCKNMCKNTCENMIGKILDNRRKNSTCSHAVNPFSG